MMAWVNLAALPSEERRFFYVAGESQNGNDFDLQFENDNALKFYTASGGHLTYTPPPATLVDQLAHDCRHAGHSVANQSDLLGW